MAGRITAAVPTADSGQVLHLKWPSSTPSPAKSILQITAAVDERVPHRVHVKNARTHHEYGHIDVLYACPGQVFELPLGKRQTAAALQDGLALSITNSDTPLWICTGQCSPQIQPNLCAGQHPADQETFLRLFCSDASIQPCDWMGACVLDGLRDWKLLGRDDASQALERHLKTFYRDNGDIIVENMHGRPNDNTIHGVESSGPAGILAQEYPEHPALKRYPEHWKTCYNADADALCASMMVGETSYNIAYPLMAMARHSPGYEHLQSDAIRQLRGNYKYLVDGDDLWLRSHPTSGERTFKNWSRGAAWYYLGLVRTLALLPPAERPKDLVAEVRRVAEWVGKHQPSNGLWPCFIKENDILPDSSGSAGIAAAITLAVREGMLPKKHLPVARRTQRALSKKLNPAGWLRGTAQSNKRETHSMDIQRYPFRVIAPWGMGLYAQLLAAMESLK